MVTDLDFPDDRLKSARLAQSFSQGDLARAAGVSRQAVSGIESGRWSPSLDVALALAHTLHTSVEELFGHDMEQLSVEAELVVGHERKYHARRLLMSDVAGRTMAFPLQCDGALVPGFVPAGGIVSADEEEGGAVGSKPSEKQARRGRARSGSHRIGDAVNAHRLSMAAPTLAVAGCDPALPFLQGPLFRHKPPVGFVWWPCGNAMALELLERDAVHVAAIHRGRDSPVRRLDDVEVVGFARWREGLAVSAQHSARVKDVADLTDMGLRIANRERGSQARALLDRELRKRNIASKQVHGYETLCNAHLLVASAIRSGLAEAGVTTEPAALAFGLGFLPWSDEVCELYIPRMHAGSIEVRALRDVLAGSELPRQLAAVDGYDARSCGTTVP